MTAAHPRTTFQCECPPGDICSLHNDSSDILRAQTVITSEVPVKILICFRYLHLMYQGFAGIVERNATQL